MEKAPKVFSLFPDLKSIVRCERMKRERERRTTKRKEKENSYVCRYYLERDHSSFRKSMNV